MISSRTTVTLLALAATLGIALAERNRPTSVKADAAARSDAHLQLEPDSGAPDSAPLHTMADLFVGGSLVEIPRRLASARSDVQLRVLTDSPADAPGHTALLRLRVAGLARLAIGDLLERDVSGAASFHTATPPPNQSV